MPEEKNTELAAALFYLLGEQIPHDVKLEPAADGLKKQCKDNKAVLHKVIELCGKPEEAKEFYICTKAYSWLGREYDALTAKYADAYLSLSGWDALPSETKIEDGISINLADRTQAGIQAILGSTQAGLGNLEKACAAYLRAYELAPYQAMYAVDVSNLLKKLGRTVEAMDFLVLQKKSYYYKPIKYRDAFGNVAYNSLFREAIDRQIENLQRMIRSGNE